MPFASPSSIELWGWFAPRLTARTVKGRHRIPVIRQTVTPAGQIGHASGVPIMHMKVPGPAVIGHFSR
jgi:hypothetical protein